MGEWQQLGRGTPISHTTRPPQSHLWEVGFGELQEGTLTAPSVENVGLMPNPAELGESLYIKRKTLRDLYVNSPVSRKLFHIFYIFIHIQTERKLWLSSESSSPVPWNLVLVLNPRKELPSEDSSFMWPRLTQSGVKQPRSPPLFLPILYFLQMYLLIYPDSSPLLKTSSYLV